MLDEAAARMFLAQNRSRRAFSMIDLHRLAVPAAIDFLTVALQKAAESLESSFPASGAHAWQTAVLWPIVSNLQQSMSQGNTRHFISCLLYTSPSPRD